MIFYKYETSEPAPLVIGSRWNYKGPIFDQMPPFPKALTLWRIGNHNNTAIVRFKETGTLNYSFALFETHFIQTEKTHEEAVAEHLINLDWRDNKKVAELEIFKDYLKKLWTPHEIFDIMAAVIRAQSFNTKHITGLNEGMFRPVNVLMDTEYNWCLPQTFGTWEVQKSSIAGHLPVHRFISEDEAKTIAGIYNSQIEDNLLTLYTAQKVRLLALREGDNWSFIPRTVGDFSLSLKFNTDDICDYVVNKTTLNEAQQICYETMRRCKEIGISLIYDIK
jgi:hypothetical protein